MKKLIALLFCSQILLSCKQISKSVEETFKPNDSVKIAIEKKPDTPVSNPGLDPAFMEKEINKVIDQVETLTAEMKDKRVVNKSIDLLKEISRLSKAETALKQLPQYKGKEIFLYSTLHFFSDGRIIASLRHPDNPKYIDEYTYSNETWSKPTPVRLSVNDRIEERILSLNKFNFTTAANVAMTYNEKAAEIEGAASANRVYIAIYDNKIKWFPNLILGSRARYSIQFNENGTLKSFKQD